ncbi:MAG: ATP synthase F1 subunit delta [Bacteroidales bacterium]|nr:ATP synthase F1 subunit delta [Bacteroidales bacterium]
MKKTKLSGRYATALYAFALEQKNEETVFNDMQLLTQVFRENRDLRVIIESPIMPAEKKEAIFHALFQGKVNEITLQFLLLIIKKRREPALTDIFENYVQCYYRNHNIKIAKITTATEMDEKLMAEIKAILEEQTHSTIILNQVVNPKIIGGIILHVDDFLFDASIIGKINKLRAEFSHNLYQTNF